MDYRHELLTMREQLMENIDSIVDDFFAENYPRRPITERDELVKLLCDSVCETIDPAGF